MKIKFGLLLLLLSIWPVNAAEKGDFNYLGNPLSTGEIYEEDGIEKFIHTSGDCEPEDCERAGSRTEIDIKPLKKREPFKYGEDSIKQYSFKIKFPKGYHGEFETIVLQDKEFSVKTGERTDGRIAISVWASFEGIVLKTAGGDECRLMTWKDAGTNWNKIELEANFNTKHYNDDYDRDGFLYVKAKVNNKLKKCYVFEPILSRHQYFNHGLGVRYGIYNTRNTNLYKERIQEVWFRNMDVWTE